MKKLGFFIVCIVLLSALIITACDLEKGDYKSFEYRLQGKWESNEHGTYVGSLEITHNSITIKGYAENIFDRNDPKRPFRDLTKNFPLKGYSEKTDNNRGIIYIEEFGVLHEIPYEYDSNYDILFNRSEILRFTFPSPETENNRKETLKKVIE